MIGLLDAIIEGLGRLTGHRPKPGLWHSVERWLIGGLLIFLLWALMVRTFTWIYPV